MARVLLGVSGGIAAYKALELVRLATAAGHSVRAIQTPSSQRFVGRASFGALTGAPVLVSEFEPDPARGAFPGEEIPEREPISHLELVSRADLYLIAPASANTLAKLAAGLADNLLTSAALAAPCPLAVAPAMNDRMWEHPATRANIELLRARGVSVIGPGAGRLASHGEQGPGRMAEPAELLARCEQLLHPAPGSLQGVRVLVTAGGTREPIDAVRFVGNRSSGRMGLALAQEALARGAEVTVIAAHVALAPPPGARWRTAGTAAELGAACAQELPGCDVLLMAAAVSDFRPAAPVASKLKKDAGPPALELEPTEDVLTSLAARRAPGQVLVGFAAEHPERGVDPLASAHAKLQRKRLDAVVLNDVSRPGIGFESDDNEVTIVNPHGERAVARATKRAVAAAILDEVERIRDHPSLRRSFDGAPGAASATGAGRA